MKYTILTEESMEHLSTTTLLRIQSLVDIPKHGVKAGDKGGWIECASNLSQEGACWVSDESKVYGGARIAGNVLVKDSSIISEETEIQGETIISGSNLERTLLSGEHQVTNSSLINVGLGERSTISESSLRNMEVETLRVMLTAENSHIEFQDGATFYEGNHFFNNCAFGCSYGAFSGNNTMERVAIEADVDNFKCHGTTIGTVIKDVWFYHSGEIVIEDSDMCGEGNLERIHIGGDALSILRSEIKNRVKLDGRLDLQYVKLRDCAVIESCHGRLNLEHVEMSEFSHIESIATTETIKYTKLSGDMSLRL